MPYFWLRMPNQEPTSRTGEIRRIVEAAGGRLIEDEAFYDENAPFVYALTDGPDDFERATAMRAALRAHEMRVLLTTDQAQSAFDVQKGLAPGSSASAE